MSEVAVKLALIALVVGGCSKAPRPPAEADRIEVLARHLPAAGQEDLAADPVVIRIEKFAVTKAHFDPEHLAGGTATIALDFTSIKSGSAERDTDLQSADYLDVAKYATATVDVTGVRPQPGGSYIADAAVAFRGVTKTYPVTFDVLSTTATGVRVRGEQAFSRLDFKVGIDPATDPTERIAAPLVLRFVLTLENH